MCSSDLFRHDSVQIIVHFLENGTLTKHLREGFYRVRLRRVRSCLKESKQTSAYRARHPLGHNPHNNGGKYHHFPSLPGVWRSSFEAISSSGPFVALYLPAIHHWWWVGMAQSQFSFTSVSHGMLCWALLTCVAIHNLLDQICMAAQTTRRKFWLSISQSLRPLALSADGLGTKTNVSLNPRCG